MPHIIFLIIIIIGIVYGMFQFFLYLIKSLMMVDERFVEKVKENDSELLNYFLDDEFDENTSEKQKGKIKIINRALRFDFYGIFIPMLVFYPFMLIQLTDISQISTDKYGKWLLLFDQVI